MAELTIRGILGEPSRKDVEAIVLALQGTQANPITDWHVGAVWRTMMKLERHVLHDLVTNAIPAMAEGAYLETSTEEWIETLAHGWYEIDRVEAGIARQAITLSCATGYGPYTIVADRVILRATDQRRYLSETGGTLTGGNSLDIDVIAESPGAARGLVNALVTSLPGVVVTAAAIKIITGEPQYGADKEGLESLRARCDARWPDIETVNEEDRLVEWAKASAPDEITRVRLDADPVNPGGVLVTVAGASGAVAGGTVTVAQAYIDDRDAITDLDTVQNATNLAINVGGTAYVPAALEDEIKEAANEAWVAYLGSTQIGDKVFFQELLQAVMDAGAIEFGGALVGAGGDGNVVLGSNEVPVAGGDLASQITWIPVT